MELFIVKELFILLHVLILWDVKCWRTFYIVNNSSSGGGVDVCVLLYICGACLFNGSVPKCKTIINSRFLSILVPSFYCVNFKLIRLVGANVVCLYKKHFPLQNTFSTENQVNRWAFFAIVPHQMRTICFGNKHLIMQIIFGFVQIFSVDDIP